MRWSITVVALGFSTCAYGGINWNLIQGLADDAAGPSNQNATYFHEPFPQAGTDSESDTRPSVSTTTFTMDDTGFHVTVTQDRQGGDYKVQSISQILFTANVNLVWTLGGSYQASAVGTGSPGPAIGAIQLYQSDSAGTHGAVMYDRELSGANQVYAPAQGNFAAGQTYLLNFSALDTTSSSGSDYETGTSGSFSLDIVPGHIDVPEPASICGAAAMLLMLTRRR